MQKQPTITVRVLASDYIKASGQVIRGWGNDNVSTTFTGWNARTQAREWVEYLQQCNENGFVETRIIVKGDLTGRSVERCDLTNALYGQGI